MAKRFKSIRAETKREPKRIIAYAHIRMNDPKEGKAHREIAKMCEKQNQKKSK